MSDLNPVIRAILRFAELSDNERNSLVSITCDTTPMMYVQEFSEKVAERAEIPVDIVEPILLGFASLAKVSRNRPRDFFVRLAELILESREIKLSEVVIEDMTALVMSEGLFATAKAHAVLWGSGRLFEDVTSITQIRPLFPHDLGEDTKYAVIAHEIVIKTSKDGSTETFSFIMDDYQLFLFRDVLNRAVEKEQSIRANGSFGFLTGVRRDNTE